MGQNKKKISSMLVVSLSILGIGLLGVISGSDGAAVEVKVPITSSFNSTQTQTELLPKSVQQQQNNVIVQQKEQDDIISSSDDILANRKSEVNSPLHVAQCRATCLQSVSPWVL
jgi:hypothetical protein